MHSDSDRISAGSNSKIKCTVTVILTGDAVSYCDFRMATFLPFNDVAELPISQYPAICRWYDGLCEIDAWRDPFRGIDAPELPPVKRAL